MGYDNDANTSAGSTTWGYKRVKIGRSAGGQKPQSAAGRRWRGLPGRNPRTPLTLSISYRGGPECWYEIRGRGSLGRWPGYVSLHDVMEEINGTGVWAPPSSTGAGAGAASRPSRSR